MNPTATFYMANGKKIVVELLPESAPNTVASFIWCAGHGWLDNHAICPRQLGGFKLRSLSPQRMCLSYP